MKPNLNRIKSLMLINEAISYTDEKIDQFFKESEILKNRSYTSLNSYSTKILDLSLNEIHRGNINSNELFSNITKEIKYLEKKYDDLIGVIDLYDVLDTPKKISDMDSILRYVDDNISTLKELSDLLSELISAHNRLMRYNKDIFISDSTVD